MTAPQFDYGHESQSASLAGVRGSTPVFCDPPFALSSYRSEDRKDAGNTFGLTGMWPRSLWATSHIPRIGLGVKLLKTRCALGQWAMEAKACMLPESGGPKWLFWFSPTINAAATDAADCHPVSRKREKTNSATRKIRSDVKSAARRRAACQVSSNRPIQ
jgi:hypothetical protein